LFFKCGRAVFDDECVSGGISRQLRLVCGSDRRDAAGRAKAKRVAINYLQLAISESTG
jgi:hypothetical protein